MPINISTSAAIHRWRPACWLRVTGEDAANFLQGQFTNDLRALATAGAVYGLWLTLKGKVLADSFVLRGEREGVYWIGSYNSPATVIRERLESHVIADDVTVEDLTADWAGVSVVDSGEFSGSAAWVDGGVRFRGRRESGGNLEWVHPVGAAEPTWLAGAAARVVDEDEMTRRRIAAGIPAIPADVGPGDLPNEAGLEADAVSYTKGCYLGQEVMARLKAMGQVRRRLVRVAIEGDALPARPAPVFVGVRQVGELRSAARDGAGAWIGLAMVSRLHVTADTALAFAADAEPSIRLREAP